MTDQQREDALDRNLSGQNSKDRLIDAVAALIAGQAYELMLSHSIEGEWPESEAHVKAEHDMMLEMVGELRELKGNPQGILDGSDHIAEASKMVKGDVSTAGSVILLEGKTYERAIVVAFESDDDLRAAIAAGQCRFTVFGGEV